MNINIQISDAAYQQLLANGKRLHGTIGLVNPTEGNFNVHRRAWDKHNRGRCAKLPHGRVSVNDNRVRLTLCIERTEEVFPEEIIEAESTEASDYVSRVIEGVWEYPYGIKY